MSQAHNEAGFTLVEMLVALAIFALLATAGVGLLRASVDTQSAVERRLYDLGSLGRAHALLASDIGQAVERPTRSGGGTRPAFVGEPGRMEFVRAGWTGFDGERRSDLQRVTWQFEKGTLVRAGFASLDGGGQGIGAVIAPGLASAGFRYRGPDGRWAPTFQPSPNQSLPTAVELNLTAVGGAPVTIIMALPQGFPAGTGQRS